jgi:hypothetical protein
MKLLTIIVNYRTPELTIDCLRSLAGDFSQLGDGLPRADIAERRAASRGRR